MEQIIDQILTQFDFTYCLVVNILTFLMVKSFNKKITTWHKRLVLLVNIILLGLVYSYSGVEYKTLINSAILAPVSWSWIFKPLFEKLGWNYKD